MKQNTTPSYSTLLKAVSVTALSIASLLLTSCESTQAAPKPRVVTSGSIGVGTWATRAEYKDIFLIHEGQAYPCVIPDDKSGWTTYRGTWKAEDGVLIQSSLWEDARAVMDGHIPWTEYTLILKARKISGREGFLILFGMASADANYASRWNIGGWNNTAHALQVPGVDERSVSGTIEEGRWYDIRLDFAEHTLDAYLDGELIHSVKSTRAPQDS